jgi:hypothetical protein
MKADPKSLAIPSRMRPNQGKLRKVGGTFWTPFGMLPLIAAFGMNDSNTLSPIQDTGIHRVIAKDAKGGWHQLECE